MVLLKPGLRKAGNSLVSVFGCLAFSFTNIRQRLYLDNLVTGRTRYGPFVLIAIAIYGGMFASMAMYIESIYRTPRTKRFHSGILMFSSIYGFLHVISIFYLMHFILENCKNDNTGVWIIMICCIVSALLFCYDFICSSQEK